MPINHYMCSMVGRNILKMEYLQQTSTYVML